MPKILLMWITTVVWAVGVAAYAAAPVAAPVIEDTASYLLQPGDTVAVSVWKEPDLTAELLVRPDGAITLPLAGQIDAAGHTVDEVRGTIDTRLRKYIPDPSVTVTLKQALGNQIFVLGKVNRPGNYPIPRPVDVVQALSLAGGTTPFAAVNDIRVLRRDGDKQITLTFRYTDIEHGRHLQQNILLHSGDTVIVP
jgi:polysaccharide export outer membrane protein